MDKDLFLTLLMLLLGFCFHNGNSDGQNLCPDRCQCFTPDQVLCADERMAYIPRNLSNQVKELVVMTSAVGYLFADSLRESPQLTKLILMNNALRSIHLNSFENLTELQELEISGNPWLDNLLPGTFSKQKHLTKLLLNFNGLRTALPGIFDSLKQLETLEMKSNMISGLPPFVFQNLSRLRVLDLSMNKLEEVTKGTFSGLEKLEILKINYNLIRNVSSDTFQNIPELTELHWEGNKIARLDDAIFSELKKLRVLNLCNNLLTTFSDNVFGFETSNLKELNLKGNRLTELSSLSSLISLTDLILSSNKLSSLPENIFRNLTALDSLDLSENQLSYLPKMIFKDLLGLTAINLHKNSLRKVHENQFADQMLVQKLYLSDNQLENLPVGLLDTFFVQHVLRLHGNPWKCDCHMWYLHDWVLQHGQSLEMPERMLCESPDFLRKRTVYSINRDELVCQPSEEEKSDLSSCTLQASNDTMIIRCRVKNCSPMTVKVQFQEENGNIQQHVVKNVSEDSKCIN
ncbi:unnamed protein product [Menidia menidia]|uniref:(Atlantic silverside) hypothetical protein n=1 Tax=Menidia menidia TaxID=238744 RepID=A0A8S4AW56_9TELE|nr:unnamed protein product [Menidia menidia]